MNLITVPVEGDGDVKLGTHVMRLPREAASQLTGSSIAIGVRQEAFTLAPEGDGIAMRVDLVEELGSEAYLHGTVPGREDEASIVVRVEAQDPPDRGDQVTI